MSLIRVAVPVKRGKRRFHLQKGRPWSLAEHVILQAIAKETRSAMLLAEQSSLPRRLVVEALIRLMRADWAEVVSGPAGTLFRATEAGRQYAFKDELPDVTKDISRWMSFIIDRLTQTAFRRNEIPIFEKHVIQGRPKSENIVWLEPIDDQEPVMSSGVFSALLEDDEKLISVDLTGDCFVDRFALILVRDGNAEGLPKKAAALEAVILDAAKKYADLKSPPAQYTLEASVLPGRADHTDPKMREVSFQEGDLLLGGDAHKDAIRAIIRKAKHRIVIHSTFIAEKTLNEFLPDIFDAAKRCVYVDILWGQNEEKPEALATRKVLTAARAKVAEAGLEGLLRLHPFSTYSHAKVIVADDGASGKDIAVVGSCNWLSSGFDSYEASLRFRDPQIIADILGVLTQLSCGRDGQWKQLTIDLASLARDIAKRPALPGPKWRACLVLGAQHGHFVREARDRAEKRIFVTSHRLGVAAKQSIIIPAIAAAQDREIDTQIFYGRPSGEATGLDTANLIIDAGKEGVKIRPVHEPRLHAKILAWDDNHLLISSQNFLSADPAYNSPFQEVGVYLEGTRVADNVIISFLNTHRH